MLAAAPVQAAAPNADLNNRLKKYIKTKRFDPLETYIAPLLLARGQLEGTADLMVRDASGVRELLRTGVFKSLRDDVRAVTEYAAGVGAENDATVATMAAAAKAAGVDSRALSVAFFRSLEAYDRCLADSLRSGTLKTGEGKALLQQALSDLDKVLALVPASMMEQAQKVVDALNDASDAELGDEPLPLDTARLKALIP